jgi:hypothetical protein
MKRLKLAWLKFLLRRKFKSYIELRGCFNCGATLAAHINPEVDALGKEVESLFYRCKALEGGSNGKDKS